MCTMTAFMIASTVLGAATRYQQQQFASEQGAEQQEYLNKQYTDRAQAAVEAAQANIDAITARQTEETTAADEEALQRQVEARREHARAVVAAGESGLGGVTAELLERDIYGEAGRDITTIQKNKERRIMQGQREKASARRSGTTVGDPAKVSIPAKGSVAGAIAETALGVSGAYLSSTAKSKSKKLYSD